MAEIIVLIALILFLIFGIFLIGTFVLILVGKYIELK